MLWLIACVFFFYHLLCLCSFRPRLHSYNAPPGTEDVADDIAQRVGLYGGLFCYIFGAVTSRVDWFQNRWPVRAAMLGSRVKCRACTCCLQVKAISPPSLCTCGLFGLLFDLRACLSSSWSSLPLAASALPTSPSMALMIACAMLLPISLRAMSKKSST